MIFLKLLFSGFFPAFTDEKTPFLGKKDSGAAWSAPRDEIHSP
jgi:hypothetical protein